ncbi:MAG: ADOP family duplicated permease [Nibricoccus sp.]
MDERHEFLQASRALASIVRGLKLAVRRLSRAPGFSLAVIFSLVICIGPNAATFSALYALVLKPLPLPEPAQLVTVQNIADRSGGQVVLSSTTQFLDFNAHADLFSGFATIRAESGTIDGANAPMRVKIDKVSANFFDVLRVQPLAGRFFHADEETSGRDRVLVLSQRYWKTHYGADPSVIGSQISLGGQPHLVVGIAPEILECLSQDTAFFQPYAPPASKFDPQTRYRGDIALYGRLKPGVSIKEGLAQLTTLENNFRAERAGPPLRALVAAAGYRLALEPLRPGGAVGPHEPLWLLQGGALFVLLIGCVNVVNLYLARMNSRRAELAIRVALGAGRPALLMETLAETVLLTGIAVILGIGGAFAALQVFNHYLPVLVAGAPLVKLDAAVLFTTIAVAGSIAVAVGFLPLQVVYRSGLRLGESRTFSSGGRARHLSSALVMSQVAFAVVLLVGATLLLRSFTKVMANDPGYDAAHTVLANVALPNSYNNAASRVDAQRRILDAFKAVPGVENAAATLRTILGNERPVPFGRRGEQASPESQPLIHIIAVSPEFFETLGMPVLSGRSFNDADDFSKTPVAIVDRSFKERYFPTTPVEGEEIYLNWGLPLAVDGWPRIVGVVSRANFTGLDSRDNLPIVYVPTVGYPSRGFDVVVRSRRATADLLRDLRTTLGHIDPMIQLLGANTLDTTLTKLLMPRRGITLLVALFSALALLLAAIGLYGVLSYDVSQRTREIGIRSAIGASRGQIVSLILRDGALTTGVGLAAGVFGAVFLTRYLGSLLFGINAADFITYATALILLAGVSFVACWLPALRAAKVDPIIALRAE